FSTRIVVLETSNTPAPARKTKTRAKKKGAAPPQSSEATRNVMSVRFLVGNLPYSATDADIREHFGTVGAPLQIVIPTDRDTGRPRGFAFVDYDDRGVAEKAIQQL